MISSNVNRSAILGVIPLLVACLALWACGSPAGKAAENSEGKTPLTEPIDPDIESVNEFLDTFQEVYSAKDLSGLSDLFMEGGKVVIDFNGVNVFHTEDWLSLTSDIFDRNPRISDRLTEREIKVYGDIAVATCRYDYDSAGEKSNGHDIFSLVRKDDRWLIVSLMYQGQKKG